MTLLTIGLCFLTQLFAGLFGVTLPDQGNIAIVRRLAGWNWHFALLCFNVLVIMPALEELLFRELLFKLPLWTWARLTKVSHDKRWMHATTLLVLVAVVSSVLFSAAHYITQPWPDAAFVALGFFGLAQCWLLCKTDHVWCPMLNHALFNLSNLFLVFIFE